MAPDADGAASGDADGVAVGEVVGLVVPSLDTALLGELVGEVVRVCVGLTVGDGLWLGEGVLEDCPVFCVLPEPELESELAAGGGLT